MKLQSMMRVSLGLGLGLGACLVATGGCSKDDKDSSKEAAPSQVSLPGAASALEGNDEAPRKSERPEEVLLETPVERRLYSDRIEASSFAWGNYNRFHENYHPNYLMDGDPVTTWLEDAPGNGIGEWVRIGTSPIAEATKIRIRIQNGYHKSESLFKKNSRVKAMDVKVLPNGPTKRFELADSMEWQELEMGFGALRFEGIEMTMRDAYGGTKYEDLCISDMELFVTGKTPENPAFEAKKLAQVKAWKESRLAAAKMFEGAEGKSLPIKSGYKVVKGDKVPRIEASDDHVAASKMLALLGGKVPGHDEMVARAQKALSTKFAGWSNLRPVIKNPIALPDVDGLVSFRPDRGAFGWRNDVFEMPALKKGRSLAQNQRIALFDSNKKHLDAGNECKAGSVHAQRPPDAVGPNASELVVWRCFEEEEREGVYRYMSWELLEYDENGWLRLAVGPQTAHVFDWEKSDVGVVLVGASRISRWGQGIAHLKAADPSPDQDSKQ